MLTPNVTAIQHQGASPHAPTKTSSQRAMVLASLNRPCPNPTSTTKETR